MHAAATTCGIAFLVLAASCDGDDHGDDAGSRCGPSAATVARVIDGDTVELEGGAKVRYLLVDTPEVTGGKDDCYGAEAKEYNASLVEGQRVALSYDAECEDFFGRLLAYVEVQGREVNTLLVERGYACVLFIAPSGESRRAEFEALEAAAREARRGMWGACEEVACDG